MRDDLVSWDAWLTAQGRLAGFGQTATWARILEATEGAEHCLVRIGDAGALLNAVLSGELLRVEFSKDPVFGFDVVTTPLHAARVVQAVRQALKPA